MANRTGQSQNIVKLDRTVGQSSVAPRVQYSTTGADDPAAAQGFRNIATVLRGINSRLEDRLDVRAQVQGQKAGAIAGMQDDLPELLDEETIRGRYFNQAAKETAITRIDLEARKQLDQYEENYSSNPQKFMSSATSYLEGQLPQLEQFDPTLAQRFKADYELRAGAAEKRVKAKHEAIVRDQQLETALRSQMALQDDLASDANNLFSGDAVQTQETMTRMISNAARLVDTSRQYGPDGRPLFDARSRIGAEREAENMVSEQIGTAWLRRQDNVLDAFNDWQSGKAEIELADENGNTQRVNLKEVLGPRGYSVAGEKFVETLRSELSLQNQIEASQDRAFDKTSDVIYSDLSTKAQDGGLRLEDVEANRLMLDPDKYLTLRSLAKSGGATVSDGKIYSDLAVDVANGVDISTRLRNAYDDGQLEREDFVKLYERNNSRSNEGRKDPVTVGRNYLNQNLGVLSKDLGMAQSAAIGQAEIEYELNIEQFVNKEGRQPTLSEARDIAETTRRRFSAINTDTALAALPLPNSLSQAEKLSKNLNTTLLQEKIQTVNEKFLQKYNGDRSLRDSDPAYLDEIKLLKQYSDIVKLKEDGNARKSDATK